MPAVARATCGYLLTVLRATPQSGSRPNAASVYGAPPASWQTAHTTSCGRQNDDVERGREIHMNERPKLASRKAAENGGH